MGGEGRLRLHYLLALLVATAVGEGRAETRNESTAPPDTTTAAAVAPVGLGEFRLFFSAEERFQPDAAFERSEQVGPTRQADPDADLRSLRPRRTTPVTPPLDFQAILQRGGRVQLLLGGQLCRAAVPQADAPLESGVHCSPLPSGTRSLAFDARSSELLIESRSGHRHRLAVGESWAR